ncbi:hypothetical protein [Piscinibacter koreensis]|uniref:Uncharacterized protein n=1 Tax=Piscinibacter koreensis TaxID=2742824 RepID=A0A7Y6NQS6_9BURK|nr:hypothetical protein [Schlegelella koreensis]NUZ07601.1 hypothetical protein [Schlegelella koreensis]
MTAGTEVLAGHVTSAVAQEAAGSVAAQQMIDRLGHEWATPDIAWLAFVEIAAKYGWRSPACRAFVHELAKRAAV